jgi:hypothetical protein
MAEIHVQAKKQSSNSWLWIVIALLAIGALVYYLMTRNNQTEATPVTPGTTSQLQKQQRPPKPAQVKIIVPIVHMRSV